MSAMNISEKQFREMMNEGKPVLVDFWAPWCGYCRRIGPAYDKIAQQYEGELQVVKINIDEEAALANAEKIEVIPTLILDVPPVYLTGGTSKISGLWFVISRPSSR